MSLRDKENKITAKDIAHFLIIYSQKNGKRITPFLVQKYLFYAQGWHLGVSEETLFDDEFEAWTHGPVIREIWRELHEFGPNDIDKRFDPEELPIDIVAFLKKYVIDKYFGYSAQELYKLVHEEVSYKEKRKGLLPDEPSSEKLDLSTIKTSFIERLQKEEDVDEINDEELEDILESRKEFKNGERLSYEEVFGHSQPGF